MTTVAANLKMIAADSNVGDSSEDFRIFTKVYPLPGGGFAGYCGHIHVGMRIIEWLQKPRSKKPEFKDEDIGAVLILDHEGLAYVDTSLRIMRLREQQFAIGSGGQAARAAMLCGRNPVEAVAIACEIDPQSKVPIVSEVLSGRRRKSL